MQVVRRGVLQTVGAVHAWRVDLQPPLGRRHESFYRVGLVATGGPEEPLDVGVLD